MRVSSPIPHKRARIEIIPLIDIMFFLLASFMMVSLSQTHMKGIRVNLPAAIAPPPTGPKDYVSIKVREGNVVTFDNQVVTDDQVCRVSINCIRQIRKLKFQSVRTCWRCTAMSLRSWTRCARSESIKLATRSGQPVLNSSPVPRRLRAPHRRRPSPDDFGLRAGKPARRRGESLVRGG